MHNNSFLSVILSGHKCLVFAEMRNGHENANRFGLCLIHGANRPANLCARCRLVSKFVASLKISKSRTLDHVLRQV